MDLIAGRFRLQVRLNSGSFGEVYQGLNEVTGTSVAVKIETQTRAPQLLHEARILRAMEGKVGLPTVMWYGKEQGRVVMVMTLLGKSLEMIVREMKEKKMNLELVLRLVMQMLARVETTHLNSYIHRDIKPDNFVIGRPPFQNRVYLIDFGLAKRYREDRTRQHIQYSEGKRMAGTTRYASLNCHRGVEQSRRDDLESLVYSLIYLLNGSLPWQVLLPANTTDKHQKVAALKTNLPIHQICKGCPPQVGQLLAYCRGLAFEENPDYEFIRFLLREMSVKSEVSLEGPLVFPKQIQRSTSQHSLMRRKTDKEKRGKSPVKRSIVNDPGSSILSNSKGDTEELVCAQLPALHPSIRLKLNRSTPAPDSGCNLT